MTDQNKNAFVDILSHRLKRIMSDRDINQRELASALGVSESTVGKWILKKTVPRMTMIQKLADYFKVEKSFFLEEDFSFGSFPSLERKSNTFSDRERKLITLYRNLPERDQQTIDTIIDNMRVANLARVSYSRI